MEMLNEYRRQPKGSFLMETDYEKEKSETIINMGNNAIVSNKTLERTENNGS